MFVYNISNFLFWIIFKERSQGIVALLLEFRQSKSAVVVGMDVAIVVSVTKPFVCDSTGLGGMN
jgi:hypothetical protein